MEQSKLEYSKLGIDSLPTKENKSPIEGCLWKDSVPSEKFIGAFGIGLKCGKVSNGLECLDFDNHFGNAEEIFTDFLSDSIIEEMLGTKLFIAKTKSGGYHLAFFSDFTQGNQKLANEKHDGKVKTTIETRGEGGYFCAEPTPGYVWSKYNLLKATTYEKVTKEERDYLISTAKSFNKVVHEDPIHNLISNTSSERIGDQYNADSSSHDEALRILLNNGWKASGYKLTRPGKEIKDGFSATFGKVAPGVFYVFSSNAYPFEAEKGYKPFQIKALLEFGGDFKACTKKLAETYQTEDFIPAKAPAVLEQTEDELYSELNDCRVDFNAIYDKPPAVMSVIQSSATNSKYIPIQTLGSFSLVVGWQKSKKTYFNSLLTASVLLNSPIDNKLVASLPEDRRQTAYFDTEQEKWRAQKVAKRIFNQAGIEFDYFSLRTKSKQQRRNLIGYYLKNNPKCSYVVIDGIVDLCDDFNDREASESLVQWLMDLSGNFNVHIVLVLHMNIGSDKARGHLGSILSQKVESVIEVKKIDGRTSTIIAKDVRGEQFEDFELWIDDVGNPHLRNANSTKDSGFF